MSPAPVKVYKPDGSSHTASAYDFKHRPVEDTTDEELAPEGALTLALLEEQVMRTLMKVMRDSEKLSERTAAATSAVKLIAIKLRVGPNFGEDLDAE